MHFRNREPKRHREQRLEEAVVSLRSQLEEAREANYTLEQKVQRRDNSLRVLDREMQSVKRAVKDHERQMRHMQSDAFGAHDGRRRRERWERDGFR